MKRRRWYVHVFRRAAKVRPRARSMPTWNVLLATNQKAQFFRDRVAAVREHAYIFAPRCWILELLKFECIGIYAMAASFGLTTIGKNVTQMVIALVAFDFSFAVAFDGATDRWRRRCLVFSNLKQRPIFACLFLTRGVESFAAIDACIPAGSRLLEQLQTTSSCFCGIRHR